MGSATTQALTTVAAVLEQQQVDAGTARDLFTALHAAAGSSQLSGALADRSAPVESRTALVSTVFGGLSEQAKAVVTAVAEQRWSSSGDLVSALEELAIRAAAMSEPDADVAGELFEVSRVVAQNPELELALGSNLGDPTAKAALVGKLLDGQGSEAARLIAVEVVRALRGRRVRGALRDAIRIVAEQSGRTVATVTVARALDAAQAERLTAALSRNYGGEIALTQIVDPEVVGGIRVQIADDIIDGSVSTRLNDLRQQLAS